MITAIRRIERALGTDAQLVVVGGAIRDKMLGRDIKDWDLATRLAPEEVMCRAQTAGIRTVPTGVKHGTVTLIIGTKSVEITTFRGDGIYSDGRHPNVVTFGVSLEQDLARRDFTINAMALPVSALGDRDWATMIIDPYNGLMDLKSGIIRTVGDPLIRFREDGLRTLRACRFSATLGFDVDPATMVAISKSLDIVSKVSIERVFAELTKLLCASRPQRGLEALMSTQLLALWLPELCAMTNRIDICGNSVWKHTIAVVRKVPPNAILRWAAILHDCGKFGITTTGADMSDSLSGYESISVQIAKKVFCRMRASKVFISKVAALICHHNINVESNWDDPTCRRLLKMIAEDGLDLNQLMLFALISKTEEAANGMKSHIVGRCQQLFARLCSLAAKRQPLTIRELAIDGNAIMKIAGRPGGLWLGVLQRCLLELVLDNPTLNQADSLRRIVEDHLKTLPRQQIY